MEELDLFYSLPLLKSLLPQEDYACWRKFVLVCWIFCYRYISTTDLRKGDALAIDFCTSCVNQYGKELVTPNMHLHAHIVSFIQDYGPVYSFWLFPFERLNGILGSYHTNHHIISVQLMTRF